MIIILTKITLEWILNEPLIKIPCLGLLVTVGRSLIWANGGILAGIVLFFGDAAKWFLPLHIIAIALVLWLLRVLDEPISLPDDRGPIFS